jgi:hypothetical protein
LSWNGVRVFLFNIVIGGTGVLLIAYGLGEPLIATDINRVFERVAAYLAPIVTFGSVIVTAITVYFPAKAITNPDPGSKILVAPLIIVGCLLGLGSLFLFGYVSNHIVNGFALLGLAGGLFRIQTNRERGADRF